MNICCKCRREMTCDKNEVGADFGHGHVYPADRFKCPECGYMILRANRASTHDPEYDTQEEYLKIVEGPVDREKHAALIAWAKAECGQGGRIAFDDQPAICGDMGVVKGDPGSYVAAWVWVYDEDCATAQEEEL